MAYDDLVAMLRRQEGFRQFPYRCTAGALTIGFGRNLDSRGVTESEAGILLHNDIANAVTDLRHALPWTSSLDEVRREALTAMVVNLGLPRLFTFRKFLRALKAKDYTQAAAEALQSRWAEQVGDRAREIAAMVMHGAYTDDVL